MNRRRAGFMLNLTLGLLVLAALFEATYFMYVRGQTRSTETVLAGEVAHQLAQGGIAAGIAWFNAPDSPSLLRGAMEDSTPAELEGQREGLPGDHAALTKLLADVGGDAALQVTLVLQQVRPLAPPDPDSGIKPDPREKVASLQVTAQAAYLGVKRRIVAYKEVRMVNVIPPVVSKFTLFVLQRLPGQDLNRVNWTKGANDFTKGKAGSGNAYAPLFLKNGASRVPEENGWVFLGGGPHALNLSWGDNGWGDQAFLLKNPWQVTQVPGAPALAPGAQSYLIQRGFITGVHTDNHLFDHFDFTQPTDEPIAEESALLHPFGAGAAGNADPDLATSPTFVLGAVSRRFLSLRYVKKGGKQAYVPYARQSDFDPPASRPAPYPNGAKSWDPFDPKGEAFNQDYATYGAYMSQVVQESVNRGLDYLADPQQLDPPRAHLDPGRVQHARNLPDFLYDPVINTGWVQIATMDGLQLFDGYLHRLGSPDLRVPERALYALSSAKLPAWLARRPKRIPGIVYLRGGAATLDQPLELDSGGILAVDGNLTLAAPVRVAPGGKPLSLVSLEGDIVVKTAGPIEASLVALAGTVRRDESLTVPLWIKGNVVANNLDYPKLCKAADPGKIVYDPRLDPTVAAEERKKAYFVGLMPWRAYYTPPAE